MKLQQRFDSIMLNPAFDDRLRSLFHHCRKARIINSTRVIAIAIGLAFVTPLSATGLSSIDRTIVKEPAYETRQPKYCLAVFGEKAQTRIWMALDGEMLFIDRNGNLDLTEPGEKVKGKPMSGSPGEFEFPRVPIADLDGVPARAQIQVQVLPTLTFVYCHIDKLPWQRAVVDRQGYLMFGSDRQHAPVLHFNGPITIGFRFAHQFKRHSPPEDLDVMVGTPGLGVGSFVRFGHEGVPMELRPFIDVAFPTNSGHTAVKMTLDKRC